MDRTASTLPRAQGEVRQPIGTIAARGAPPPEEAGVRAFRDVGEEFVRLQESGWKNPVHRPQWRSTLETYAYPTLGDMPMNAITTVLVRAVLEPIWTSKTETADRLRGRIERILASAKALGLRSGANPAA